MKCFIATMMIIALVLAPVAVMAAPDLSAPGSFYVDLLADGSNHDAVANGWVLTTADFAALCENGDYFAASLGDTEFKMTVTGLSDGQYDVAVLYFNQRNNPGDNFNPCSAGLVSGSPTELNPSNSTPTGVNNGGNWYQDQSNPGVIGTGTASGGELDIFFTPVDFGAWATGRIDGVVLTPLGGGATPGTLIYGK